MTDPTKPNLTSFACRLGLQADADEATVAAAIRGLPAVPWPAIAEALGSPADATPADCIAQAALLKSAHDAEEANLRDKLRTARVEIMIAETIREASDSLGI